MVVKMVVTGTGTGVGKTVLAALLVRRMAARGLAVAVFKPLCSGGRNDAAMLRRAAGNLASLDVVNPWHFRAPLAPALAARLEKRPVLLREVLAHVRNHSRHADALVVEAAGGLLSPLTEDGDAPDLIRRLRAMPIVVTADRLGVIHDVRATMAALPRTFAARAIIVLMATARPDSSCRHNARLIGDYFGTGRVFRIPRLVGATRNGGPVPPRVRGVLDGILARAGIPRTARRGEISQNDA